MISVSQNRLFSTVTVLTLCISPSIAVAFSMTDHPCLSDRKAIALDKPFEFSPSTIAMKSKGRFLLDGLLVETLPDLQLAAKKKHVIQTFLSVEKSGPTDDFTLQAWVMKNRKADRYNRKRSFITHPSQPDKPTSIQSLQEELLLAGLARVTPTTLSKPCADHLLDLEQSARTSETGMWANNTYRIKSAQRLSLLDIVSTYQLISGEVESVSRNPDNTSYLNFGRNWQKDFTVSLSKKALANWEKDEKLHNLKNRHIVVRGWIENRGGPLIRITHPSQLRTVRPSQ